MKRTAVIFFALGMSAGASAQSNQIEKTITQPQTIYSDGRGAVQIQFMLFPCTNKLSDRKYGFVNSLYLPGGRIQGKFDYQLCDGGGTHTERFTLYLDKTGEIRSEGAWILNTNRIYRVYDVELFDPETQRRAQEEREGQERARRAAEEQERERQEIVRQREEERRKEEQRVRTVIENNTRTLQELNNRPPSQNERELGESIGKLADMELISLSEADAIAHVSGGINTLLSPLLTSDLVSQTRQFPVSWDLSIGLLSRRSVSFNGGIYGVSMADKNFAFTGYSTQGNLEEFSGVLKAKANVFSFSIGKDFFSKNGRFHLYLGPMGGWMTSIENSFDYGGSSTYEERDYKTDQWMYGGEGQLYLFFSQRLGLNLGVRYNRFVDKPSAAAYYNPAPFWIANLGLSFRWIDL